MVSRAPSSHSHGRACGRGIVHVILFLALLPGALCRVFGLDTTGMQSMVIVEGDKGRGSAFVVKMDGRVYLVTNSHVIRGNKTISFKNLSNQELATGPLEIAEKEDLVRAELSGSTPALEVASRMAQNVNIGDAITVFGNSEGEGVVRQIPGKVVGIGPDRVEVDAPFVPGNSGSPIILNSTGQIIGVATYLKIPRSLRGKGKATGSQPITELNEVRRFGFRLDTATWLKVQPADRILKEGLKLHEIEEMSKAIIGVISSSPALVARAGSSAYLRKEETTGDPYLTAMARWIDEFSSAYRASRANEDRRKVQIKFFEHLKAATSEDLRGFNQDHFSGYFAILFKEELEHRKELWEYIEGAAGQM